MKKNRVDARVAEAISADSIPVTIPSSALSAIGDGYEFVETLDFPQEGSGGVYNSGVFEDVLEALKKRPIPGDKRGHQENPNDDFFVIGGKIVGNQVQFRVRVPETDYAGQSNDGFIRSLKTGNQKLSLVLDVLDEGGEYNSLHSSNGLRNDAVGTLPAMKDQSIHANKFKGKESELLALVKRGKICESESNELIVNGLVNLTAVKKIKPLDNPLRNKILNASKSKFILHKEKPKMDEEKLAALVKDSAAAAVKAALEEQNKDKETKKNAADVEQAKEVMALARKVLGEEAADLDAEEVFKRLTEVLKNAEEAAAESEANKFVGANLRKNKEGKDSAIFTHAKKEFLALGHGVLVRNSCTRKHEELGNSEVLKALRKAELNPAITTTASEFDSDGTF